MDHRRADGRDGRRPGTDLGNLGWFTGVWAVMMAAMMLPSLAPTAASYARFTRATPARKTQLGRGLAWHSGGHWVDAAVLATAALYQLSPLKRTYLTRCRGAHAHPSAGSGPFVTGLRNGGWCVGCSWALMAALFALGAMSLTWMAVIGALVAVEKAGPGPRLTASAGAALLTVLAVAILAAPTTFLGSSFRAQRARRAR